MSPNADTETIRTYRNEDDDRILHIDLDRPEQNNVVDSDLLRELGAAIEAADADADVDAMIVGTSGDHFSAGGSLEELGSLDREAGNRFLSLYVATVELLRETGKPTVAAVKGNCVAGGNEIVMGADIIVGGESARFGQPEAVVGSTAAGGGVQMMPLIVGEQRAKDLLLTGRLLSAEEAEDWGLINRVVDDEEVDDHAVEVAQNIIDGNSPQGYRVIKAMLKQWSNLAMMNRDVAREMSAAVWDSEEFRDRSDSFLAREDLEPRSFQGTLPDSDED